MSDIVFTVPGEPVAKGRPRFRSMQYTDKATGQTRSFNKAYTPQNTINYENLVKVRYMDMTNNYRFDDEAYISADVTAYYSTPKSMSKKRKQMALDGLIRPTKKPDVDNIVKVIFDALNEIAYKDDSQVVQVFCRKLYSDSPRVEVRMRTC